MVCINPAKRILLNAEAGYQINKTWRVSAEVLNLLDRRDHDIDYAYEFTRDPAAHTQHFKRSIIPSNRFQVRVGLTARF